MLGKLNGVLVVMTLAAWAALAIALRRFGIGRRLAVAAAAALAAIVAFGAFVALNPAMTAHPKGPLPPHLAPMRDQGVWERTKTYWGHRVNVSNLAQDTFPRDALRTPLEKLEEVAVQGFGRFGPFGPHASDSTRRFDWRQDRGASIWGPWVALGLAWAAARGRAQLRDGLPPTAWAVLIQALLAMATVTAFIPLAWDRYHLPIVAGSALVASGAAVSAFDRIMGRRAGPGGAAPT